MRAYIQEQIADHLRLAAGLEESLASSIEAAVDLLADALGAGGKLLLFGNGGSAADAQHIAAEMVVRLSENRRPLPALALTADTSTLTAAANDYGFAEVFARQIEALARPGDIAIGISTSGQSKNVIRGLQAARKMGVTTLALGGGRGGRMIEFADHSLIVPSQTTARIQEMHVLIGHLLVGAVERKMGLIS
ncbi:MAG: D-sedoheptulose 7-phosphate isomerase [Acidobacteriota bacterium]